MGVTPPLLQITASLQIAHSSPRLHIVVPDYELLMNAFTSVSMFNPYGAYVLSR